MKARLFFLLLLGITTWGAESDLDSAVRKLLLAEERQEDLAPFLPEAVKSLDSPDINLRLAAMRVLISAGKAYPSAVPGLLKILEKPARNRRERECAGHAAAALTVVCRDEKVFSRLLDSKDKALRKTISSTLLDSNRLTPALRKKLDWPGHGFSSVKVPSQLPDGGFEAGIADWKLKLCEGAQAVVSHDCTVSRTGRGSLKLTKTNGLGFVELRSRKPVVVPANQRFFWRGFYRVESEPGSALMMFRLEDDSGRENKAELYRKGRYNWQGQSYLRNTPPGGWHDRLQYLLPASKERLRYPVIRFYGNPFTVNLDDLSCPAPPWKPVNAYPVPAVPRYSAAEMWKLLAARKKSSAKVGVYPSGALGIDIDGKLLPPVLYYPYTSDFGDYRLFRDAGTRIYNVVISFGKQAGPGSNRVVNLASGPVWISPDKYDFTPALARLKRVLRCDPEANIVLGFDVQWPENGAWNRPEMLWRDEKGRIAYGTRWIMRGFCQPGQLPSGTAPWPSPFADEPLDEVMPLLRKFIRELKKNGMAKAVVGTFICGGHDGQFEIRFRDYGAAGVRTWRRWLKARYGSDATLQQAWRNSAVTLGTAQVPPQNFYIVAPGDSPEFLSPKNEIAAYDYEVFREARIWEIKKRLTGVVKAEFGKPMLGIAWQMHKFFAKDPSAFFRGNELDIIVTQPPYQHRRPGMPTGDMTAFESMKIHRKIWITELDLRSHLRSEYKNEIAMSKIGIPQNVEEWRSTFRHLVAEQIASGGGGWWLFDISQNGFSHPDLMNEIQRASEVFEEVNKCAESQLENKTVVVLKRDAICAQRLFNGKVSFWFLIYQGYALFQSGIPFDIIYLDDLMNSPRAKKYRLYCFLNAFDISDAEKRFIDSLKVDGRTLLFHYAAGYVNREQGIYDLAGVSKLVGMNVVTEPQVRIPRVYSSMPGLLPIQGAGDIFRAMFEMSVTAKSPFEVQRFTIDDPAVKVFGRYVEDDAAALGIREFPDWRSVYVASAAGLSPEFFHFVAGKSGVYQVCAPNLAVAILNRRFLSVYALKNGPARFLLPERCRVTDAFSKTVIAPSTKELTLQLKAGETRWFLLSEPK
jgi:hypothetical protein